jgi:hypothetical protein
MLLTLPLLDSSPYEIREDHLGVPIVDYGWLMGKYIGERRYPVTIASSADKHYRYFKRTGDPDHLEKFFNNLEWLIENRRETDEFVVFPSSFEYPSYSCKEGWVSSMAQGFALKNLVHAYEITEDEGYLILARKVLKSYKVEIEDGGVLYVDPEEGGNWYAEYACAKPPMVLNGFWYALDGLYYYSNFTGDAEAEELYESGVEELLRHISEYDSGSWTYYDLERYPSDETYHALHIEVMENLYNQTGNNTFLEYQQRWQTYNFSKTRFNYMLAKGLVLKFL